MCELLAMSSRLPSRLTDSLHELAAHGGRTNHHADGWGAAFYDDQDVALFREGKPASNSSLLRFLEREGPCTNRVIAHIRHATRGAIALTNTQPFVRELGGRTHVFAHNGDLSGFEKSPGLQSRRFRPVGTTDSEAAFCALLDRLFDLWSSGPPTPALDARLCIISQFASELRELGPANFLYSDSDVLFVHAHRRIQPVSRRIAPPGLYLLSRACAQLDDDDTLCHPMNTPGSQSVAIVSSVPLTDENWRPLAEAAVVVISAGHVIANSRVISP